MLKTGRTEVVGACMRGLLNTIYRFGLQRATRYQLVLWSLYYCSRTSYFR